MLSKSTSQAKCSPNVTNYAAVLKLKLQEQGAVLCALGTASSSLAFRSERSCRGYEKGRAVVATTH